VRQQWENHPLENPLSGSNFDGKRQLKRRAIRLERSVRPVSLIFHLKELRWRGVTGFWHNPGIPMTKTELQSALAEATQTDKRTAGVFLDTLSAIAYKEIKKNGEFVLPGFGKLVKQKRKARTGFNPKTQQKIKIPAKTVVKFRVAKAAKDGVLGVKK
jgi:DNA-binding protein HU-beta